VKIEKNRRVRIKVKLQVEDGDVLEESAVEYFHGAGNMLEGLEEELEGLTAGDKKEGVIPAAKAFGGAAHQHEKKIPRNEFPADAELKVGTSFVAGGGDGQDVLIEVVEISDDEVKAMLKHPLADKNIVFEAEVLSVTDPAPPPMPADALVDES
jgi:FKBP-type peptidyl-prolyl cis-trans isomerase 2